MRARPPVTRVEDGHLIVRTELEAADGTELAPIEVRIATAHADMFDPTATPGLPTLALLAALRGEDLVVEGLVDARAAAGAADLAALASGWWASGQPISVEVEQTYDAPRTGEGVGLFFSRGVDSWSTLLDLLDAADEDRVTRLISIKHGPLAILRTIEDEVIDGNRAIARELGLDLIVVSTDVRAHLDPLRRWGDTYSAVTASCGFHAAVGLRRLILSGSHKGEVATRTGTDPELVATLGTSSTELVTGNPGRSRDERVAHLLGSRLARRTLQVCWEGLTAGNCGRCLKCQLTMSSLLLAGDPDPTEGFDHHPDPSIVQTLTLAPAIHSFVAGLIAHLPPAHEELRRAWSDAWERSRGIEPTPRWGDEAPPALSGPTLSQRVAVALRATTGQAVAPAPRPLGWSRGAVPLRPALDRHEEIRALADAMPDRPHAWAVVEPHIRDGARDGRQADLALTLAAHHGAGPCYLPGILWAHLDPPVLDPTVVQALLRTARVRAWWRAEGDLEALRVVEAIEQGCLPLQVMPTAAAVNLAGDLPSALAPLVVDETTLAHLDLSPAATAGLLAPVLDHLLAGSAEHDLLVGAYT